LAKEIRFTHAEIFQKSIFLKELFLVKENESSFGALENTLFVEMKF
jgi:hypothetical protein